jgi:glucan phosphoethanolaminetransferase (alkaline phosphatase superfamily)
MIQRIQTVFLFLVGVCLLAVLFLPIWQKTGANAQEKAELTAFVLNYYKGDAKAAPTTTYTFYIAICAITASLLAFYTIFRYDNRVLQIKLCLLNTLFIAGTLGLMVVFNYSGEALIKEPKYGAFAVGFYMPAIALIFNMLARRFIKKDEDLVRSMDRLR